MIVSVNWLKKFVDIDLPIEQLASLTGERLVEIESVVDLGAKYAGVIIAKVVEAAPLEGSDHLNVTKIDDGGAAQDVERDENGLVQVVCGAPNVRAGILVAWLPPRSVVPETFGSDEPFVLGARALRGAMSNGMLASARELDLYDEHDGILEVDIDAAPGTPFAEAYELNDYLLDIENKSLTHRPDAFGVIGFAREVAGIQGKPFATPEWAQRLEPFFTSDTPLQAPGIAIEDPSLSDRFTAIVLSGVNESAQSPQLVQTYLARSGVRPINASVDVSNYLMLLTGQPTHAYDYDKVKAVSENDFTIRVRSAHLNEKLVLLDGREITMDPADIVIAAGDTAIGLAGIMGGQNTLTDAATKTLLFEAATFDLYHLRSSQMRHGIFSEAVTRFTKGVPAPLSGPVTIEAVRLLSDYAGAQVASGVVQDYPGKKEPVTVKVETARVNALLGTKFAAEDVVELLQNVGFEIAIDTENMYVTVPYWRADIHIAEDIVEEVGRLAGFDTINPTMPRRDFTAVLPTAFENVRLVLRQSLVRAGANEVLTYSFVHGDVLRKVGQDVSDAYKITNSISPELQHYRQSLSPNLLGAIHPNIKAGFDSFALFEANKVHRKSAGMTDEAVPVEIPSLALVVTTAKPKPGSAYYEATRLMEHALQSVGLEASYEPISEATPFNTLYEPKRAALVRDVASGRQLGFVGEYTKAVQKAMKLPEYTAGFELQTDAIAESASEVGLSYQPLSKYPGTERDICFQVGVDVPYAAIVVPLKRVLEDTTLLTAVRPLDLYRADGSDTKNVTVRVQLASYEKTLTNEETNELMQRLITAVLAETEGKVI